MEAVVKAIYRHVRPIDGVEPAGADVALGAGEARVFSVRPLVPLTRYLEATWSLERIEPAAGDPVKPPPAARRIEPDGAVVERARVRAADLGPGTFRLRVVVRDPTPWVLVDEEGLLSQTRDWTIRVER
jgi:hypothetical protein